MNRLFLAAGIPVAIGLVLFAVNNATGFDFQLPQQEASTPIVSTLDPNVTYENIISGVNYESTGKQYPPASAAKSCLFYFSHVRNETAWGYGVYTADWLQAHGNETDDYLIFQNDFPSLPHNLTSGWKSAQAQSKAADCFLAAYDYTNDPKYLTLAEKSLMFLQVPVEQGGVMTVRGGGWWYDSYGADAKQDQIATLASLSNYLQYDPDDRIINKMLVNGQMTLNSMPLEFQECDFSQPIEPTLQEWCLNQS